MPIHDEEEWTFHEELLEHHSGKVEAFQGTIFDLEAAQSGEESGGDKELQCGGEMFVFACDMTGVAARVPHLPGMSWH